MNKVEKNQNYTNQTFEDIKHIDENGIEYWYARELMKVLSYKDWRYFDAVIEKAKIACQNSGISDIDHFVVSNKMVEIGSGAKREQKDYKLTRYACYLIAQNANPRLKVVSLAQTYFAVQTRKQELLEQFEELTEDQKRLAIRRELKSHNKSLAEAAQNAGIATSQEFATFQNYGYMGLYGGLTAQGIKQRKGLKKSQNILDHMGSTELAANLFRATQTDEKLRRENIQGKNEANNTHYVVGKKVRQTIAELGGTMPEDLPTPEKSIKQIEKEHKTIIMNSIDNK